MRPRRTGLLFLAALLALPVIDSQTTLPIVGLVVDERAAATPDATVILTTADGTQRIVRVTNTTGHFEAALVAGNYRLQVYHRNETGELWHDLVWSVGQARPFENPLRLNRTLPLLPRTPVVALPGDPLNTTDDVPRGTEPLLHVALAYPGPQGANRTVRIEVLVRAENGSLLQTNKFAPVTVTPRGIGWSNETLRSIPPSRPFDRERRLVLDVRLVDNSTGALYDVTTGIVVDVFDECPGAARALVLELRNGPQPFLCVDPLREAAWIAWSSQARDLETQTADWLTRARANASAWRLSDALVFWRAYGNATDVLRGNVSTTLDEAQTDASPYPDWDSVESVRATVFANHTALRALVTTRVDQSIEDRTRESTHDRMNGAAVLAGAVVGLAAPGAVAGFFIVRLWKNRTEYWIGYSARGQPPSPFLLVSLLSGAALGLGGVLAFFLGFPEWFLVWMGGG